MRKFKAYSLKDARRSAPDQLYALVLLSRLRQLSCELSMSGGETLAFFLLALKQVMHFEQRVF